MFYLLFNPNKARHQNKKKKKSPQTSLSITANFFRLLYIYIHRIQAAPTCHHYHHYCFFSCVPQRFCCFLFKKCFWKRWKETIEQQQKYSQYYNSTKKNFKLQKIQYQYFCWNRPSLETQIRLIILAIYIN